MKAGIIGLPLVGKTTVFELLTHHAGRKGGRELNVGVAHVSDPRLLPLARIFESKKITPASIEYIDMPAISRGSARHESLGLPALSQPDMFLHVLRAFRAESVPHLEGSIDPRRDFEALELELILADLAIIEGRLARLEKDLKKMKSLELELEQRTLLRLKSALEREIPLRDLELTEQEEKIIRGFGLLSVKPVLGVVNIDEDDIANMGEMVTRYRLDETYRERRSRALGFVAVSAKLEREITELSPEEARAFRQELGIWQPAEDRIVAESYKLYNLITFFTGNQKELRAWSIKRGTAALQAAGIVHSDFERGFIRAEVVPAEELLRLGSLQAAREQGALRLEGKDYTVADGDVIFFRAAP